MAELCEIFCDGMVFQAHKPIRIFGTGKGNIKILFNDICKQVVSNEDKWCLEFPSMQYGGPYKIKIDIDGVIKELNDIYIGDVYLISGQSNLKLKLNRTNEPVEDYISDEKVCGFTVTPPEPEVFSAKDGWVKLKSERAGDWSGVGYYIGTMMSQKSNHKIGLVFCYHGAACIQSFLPNYITSGEKYKLSESEKFMDHQYFWNEDSYIYDNMLSKILPFSFDSVVWYQGESNTSDSESKMYEFMLEDLIDCFRRDFVDPNLPFVIVQLADFDGRDNAYWHKIQSVQMEMQTKIPLVKTVVSRDVCETNDIHPASKRELSKRIVDAIDSFVV